MSDPSPAASSSKLGLKALIGSGDKILPFTAPFLSFCVLLNTWIGLVIGIALYVGARMYAPKEEEELAKRFGPAWNAYTRNVKIPWL